jgi:hypothetical protein
LISAFSDPTATMLRLTKATLFAPAIAILLGTTAGAFHPSQGLWVGEIALNAVNEATGAVGNSNTYEFRDPRTVTPTADTAFLRLILHVNGAGQVSLLKSVAIVEREAFPGGGTNLLLITDPNLYPQFPGIARRIASASFDFGNQQAVTAVQSLMDTATQSAVSRVVAGSGGTQSIVESAVLADLQPVVSGANVNSAYLDRGTGATSFLTKDFFSEADVDLIANAAASLIHQKAKVPADFAFRPEVDGYQPFPSDPLAGSFAARVTLAKALRDRSFYKDTRGLEAIAGVAFAAAVAAEDAGQAADLEARQAAARRAAQDARHNAADVAQAYNRFLAGSAFGAIRVAVPEVAVNAALDAQGRGRSQAQIAVAVKDALVLNNSVASALTEAVTLKSASLWGDPRAERSVQQILDQVAAAAAEQVIVSTERPALRKKVEDTVVAAYEAIKAAPVFTQAPSAAYTGFVTAASYQAAAATAAKTATSEVLFQYRAGVTDAKQLTFFSQRAVNKALTSIRSTAAVLPQNSIPLSGNLAPGGKLGGVIHLPALAPTNPFMHRRHPDHPEGFPITRRISIEVDVPAAGDTGRAGYGVSRITGTYFEEILGLHKPLGSNQDIGLRTQGAFDLNRLTLVDALNF